MNKYTELSKTFNRQNYSTSHKNVLQNQTQLAIFAQAAAKSKQILKRTDKNKLKSTMGEVSNDAGGGFNKAGTVGAALIAGRLVGAVIFCAKIKANVG